jgi:hypothetical protein
LTYIVAILTYPIQKIDEVIKLAAEVTPKYPPNESLSTAICPGAIKTTKNGITSIYISEVKPGKLQEALTLTSELLVNYRNIEGFNYTVEVFSNTAEAYGALGLTAPQ